ncbi:MAG: HAD-IA family hydrolase [Proteobacteria bacterium]|nr:HAD-IA family hydrolase [Pseudomonadota bacterium]
MKPLFIFFDLVGTLIYPNPPVVNIYHKYGKKFGSRLSRSDIQARFKEAFGIYFTKSKFEQTHSNEEVEIQRWKSVIEMVFTDISDKHENLFDELWIYFSKPESWVKNKCVTEYVRRLHEMKIYVGVASNFDKRIMRICMKHFPYIRQDRINYSTEIGYAKPNPLFYQAIKTKMNQIDGEYIMVGDDLINDIEAAKKAGWYAIHTDNLSELDTRFNIII